MRVGSGAVGWFSVRVDQRAVMGDHQGSSRREQLEVQSTMMAAGEIYTSLAVIPHSNWSNRREKSTNRRERVRGFDSTP